VKQIARQDAPDIPICNERRAVVARERDPKAQRKLKQVDQYAQRDERMCRAWIGCVFADLVDPIHAREAARTVGQAPNPRAQCVRELLGSVVVFEISTRKQIHGASRTEP